MVSDSQGLIVERGKHYVGQIGSVWGHVIGEVRLVVSELYLKAGVTFE